MMFKNYLIQAHNHPDQLSRLIHALNDGHSFFYIHIDLKADQHDFARLISLKNVKFIENRVDCIWGDFSLVRATIHLLEEVVRDGRPGFAVLLSGQDYPIKSNVVINEFLSRNAAFNFMDVRPIEENWPSFKLRTHYYKFNASSRRGDYVMYKPLHPLSLLKALYGCARGKIHPSRLVLLTKKRGMHVLSRQYGGSQWFALNEHTLKKVCAFIAAHQEELFSYYQYSFCADEIFFHSIVKHLSETVQGVHIRPSLTYVNWNGRNGEFPVTFELMDKNEILSQPEGKLFARKFDSGRCARILDVLDDHLL